MIYIYAICVYCGAGCNRQCMRDREEESILEVASRKGNLQSDETIATEAVEGGESEGNGRHLQPTATSKQQWETHMNELQIYVRMTKKKERQTTGR